MSIPKEAVSVEYAVAHLCGDAGRKYWAVDSNGEMYLFHSKPELDPVLQIWKPSDPPDFPTRCARIDMSEYGPNGWKMLSGECTW